MKRTILLFLLLALFLSGCAGTETAPPATDPVEQLPTWQTPDTQLHASVKTYKPSEAINALQSAGDSLLVTGNTELTLLKKGALVVTAPIASNTSAVQILSDGFGCYLPDSNELQLLDRDLKRTGSYQLPEQPDDVPMIAPDGKTAYYCVGPEIKVYDLELKITRKLKFTTCTAQKLTGIWLDGSVLSCAVTYDTGKETVMYISTQDGSVTHTDNGIAWMVSSSDNYMLQRKDGSVRQLICGKTGSAPSNLQIPEQDRVFPVIELGGMVSFNGTDTLAFFDASTGKQTATVKLSETVDIQYVASTDDGIWFSDGQLLCCWDLKQTPAQDETVYKTPLYTRGNPDADGLAQCQTRADALSATYGVQILLAEAAVAAPGDYTLESEYQIPDITAMLDQLEKVLQTYPAEFLKTSSKNSVQLCIVRSVSGEAVPVFYWHEATPRIVLPVGCDAADAVAMGMGYVVNSRVISASTKLDKWLRLNPKKFEYGDAPEETWLEGENRAFVDAVSATSATEDRSRIFRQAMKPDNADTFSSEAMQKKLEMLCTAIRDTWDWKKSPETFPWEQYLAYSLTYQK